MEPYDYIFTPAFCTYYMIKLEYFEDIAESGYLSED